MDQKAEVSKGAKFCKDTCPWCRRARIKGGVARWSVKNLERKYCLMCRAYEREYGRPAYE
jgi:hypothetical protein